MLFTVLMLLIAMPTICYICWVGKDLVSRQQPTKVILHQHLHHIFTCCLLALMLAGVLIRVLAEALEGILLLISGLLLMYTSLHDMRAEHLQKFQTLQQQWAAYLSPLRRRTLSMAFCSLGIFMFIIGLAFTTTMIAPSWLNPIALLAIIMGCLLLLIFLMIALNNRWYTQSVSKAHIQQHEMSEGTSSLVEAEYQKIREHRNYQNSFRRWQFKNLLLGLWPPAVLIFLATADLLWHISKAIIIPGLILSGLLAIVWPLSNMPKKVATMPTVTTQQKQLLLGIYLFPSVVDGLLACSIAIIMAVAYTISTPLSLLVLGVIVIFMIIAAIIFIQLYKQRQKDHHATTPAEKTVKPAMQNSGRIQWSSLLATMRTTVMFTFSPSYLEHIIYGPLMLLVFLYLIILMAAGLCMLWPIYEHQKAKSLP